MRVALKLREGGLISPCNWPFRGEICIDLLCSFGFVKTYSQTYKNIEKTRALIVMEAGTPVSYFQNGPVDEHTDLKFVNEDMIPDEQDQPTQ